MTVYTQPPWLEPRTAYVHIPFCGHQCGYCDFAVTVGQDELIDTYLNALEQELQQLAEPKPMETMFIGGGTPTYLSPRQLEQLLTALCHWFPLLPGNSEFSIESTPDSITEEKVAMLKHFGMTRVSVGVQSFRPALLQSLDRQHSVSQIAQACDWVRKYDMALSLDLIFAAPGATLADWKNDIKAALALKPQHISTYGLTYETGTQLWKDRQKGKLALVTEDTERAMYEFAIETLPEAGYEHYEVSNFAKPGHRCKHNERYWANHAYYGVGVGAARYVRGSRELNVRNTKDYIARVSSGETPTFQKETLEPEARAWETVAIQMRRADGIHRGEFQEQTGFDLDTLLKDRLRVPLQESLLQDNGNTVRLTRKGYCVADGIVTHVLA